jgi:hypothetical protein
MRWPMPVRQVSDYKAYIGGRTCLTGPDAVQERDRPSKMGGRAVPSAPRKEASKQEVVRARQIDNPNGAYARIATFQRSGAHVTAGGESMLLDRIFRLELGAEKPKPEPTNNRPAKNPIHKPSMLDRMLPKHDEPNREYDVGETQ